MTEKLRRFQAAPYLIRLWEENPAEGWLAKAALWNITGVSIGSDLSMWKDWWRDNYDQITGQ